METMPPITVNVITNHVIELGFPRPESISEVNYYDEAYTTETEFEYDYSIGELIEFLGINMTLPKIIQGELIDMLYEDCVKLKNEGVI